MKTLSTLLAAALGGPVQRPALLVQMSSPDFGTLRWSTANTVAVGADTYEARDIRVENLSVQAFKVSGDIVLGNADGAAAALLLTYGVKSASIVISGFDAALAAPTAADVVWIATAAGALSTITATEARIALRHPTEFVQSPRSYVDANSGFTQMLPADTVLRINGIDYRLER